MLALLSPWQPLAQGREDRTIGGQDRDRQDILPSVSLLFTPLSVLHMLVTCTEHYTYETREHFVSFGGDASACEYRAAWLSLLLHALCRDNGVCMLPEYAFLLSSSPLSPDLILAT